METKVIPYISGSGKARDTKDGNLKVQSSNIWQFLAKNEKGATFELPYVG